MTLPLIASFTQTIFQLLLGCMAIFLILLILVQRGRGGGLAGALGGMGGSSAFGAKAGDVFTKITGWSALIWILLCIVAARQVPSRESRLNTNISAPASATVETGPVVETAEEAEPAGQAAADAAEESGVDASATAGAEVASEAEPAEQ